MEQESRQKMQALRNRCGLSIRKLAEKSGVTAGMISSIERGTTSPSLTTLQKILSALDTSLANFFGGNPAEQSGPIYTRENMRIATDGERYYTIVFQKTEDIHVEMFDEQIYPSKKPPVFEKLECDIAGYILSGNLTLEIKDKPKRLLRPGDAFYIKMNTRHHGIVEGDQPVRLITIYYPARY